MFKTICTIVFVFHLFQVCYSVCDESLLTSNTLMISSKPCPTTDLTVVAGTTLIWRCHYSGGTAFWNLTRYGFTIQPPDTSPITISNSVPVSTLTINITETDANLSTPFQVNCGVCSSNGEFGGCDPNNILQSNPVHVIIFGPPLSATSTPLMDDSAVLLSWQTPISTVTDGVTFSYKISITDVYTNTIIDYTIIDTTNVTLTSIPTCKCGDCQWTLTATANNSTNISGPVTGSFSLRSAPTILDDVQIYSVDAINLDSESSLVYINFTVDNLICNENSYKIFELNNDGDTISETMLYPEIVNDYLIANVSLSNSTAFIIISAYNSIGNDSTNPISIDRDEDLLTTTANRAIITSSYYIDLTPIITSINLAPTSVITTNPNISPPIGGGPISDTVIIVISVVSLLIVTVLILGIIVIALVLLKKRHKSYKFHHKKDLVHDVANQKEILTSVSTQKSEPIYEETNRICKSINVDANKTTSDYSEPISKPPSNVKHLSAGRLSAHYNTITLNKEDIRDTVGYSEIPLSKKPE